MVNWEDLPALPESTHPTTEAIRNEAEVLRAELQQAQQRFRIRQLPSERRANLLRFTRIALASTHTLYPFSPEEVLFLNQSIPLIPYSEILLTTQELLLELFLTRGGKGGS